ncbi:hypothetical protein BN1723_001523 [Verticillium longisporum]|uniref:Uncharacterized protein n=1 Tax=Verticillium longisporum TaxID=100787 RepID=A0A0G4LS06_VERLO|nr:hypothetical protein HYQ44_011034 [Verticillium longisporum]CRJ88145.1 hypothetical protein BN1723_001523 [Verticillium longisporum]CRK24851.1 hypothetical protein BN1708_014043 [Verticillium longisporum]
MSNTQYVSAMSIPGLERAMMPKLVHQTKKPQFKVVTNQPAMASQSTLVGHGDATTLKDSDSLCKLDVSPQRASFFGRIKKHLA